MGWGVLWAIGAAVFGSSAIAAAPPVFYSLPSEPAELSVALDPNTPPVARSFEWRAPETSFEMCGGKLRVATGAEAVALEGLPILPKTAIELHWGRAPVRIAALETEASAGGLELELTPIPANPLETKLAPLAQRYFPGSFVRFVDTAAGTRVVIFPLQYDRERRRLVRLKRVRFVAGPAPAGESAEALRAPAVATSLIVSPRALEKAARKLQAFHAMQWGIGSGILWIDDVATVAPLAVDEYPDGYKGTSQLKDWVKPLAKGGYDFVLARRLATKLREWKASLGATALPSITLLGDARAVPPSYYFFPVRSPNGEPGVTDWCYAATGLCLAPWAAIGRLPFASEGELDTYLAKLKRWNAVADKEAASELALFGGKAFRGPGYIGELSALRLLEPADADWRGVQKRFRTGGDFSRPEVLKLATSDVASPLTFFVDHGSGNQFYIDGDYVSTNDLLAESRRVSGAGSAAPSVVVSIACANAAFDAPLLKLPIYDADQGTDSVGVTLLKLPAGAPAYLGMGRPALGSPVFSFDAAGDLVPKASTFGLQLLESFFSGYRRAGAGPIGRFVVEAIRDYAQATGNQMTETRHRWTLWNTILLGDPNLPLPTRSRTADPRGARLPIAESRQVLDPALRKDGPPRFPVEALNRSEWGLTVPTDARVRVWSTRYDDDGRPVEKLIVDRAIVPSVDPAVALPALRGPGLFLMRVENRAGVARERQIWFETGEPLR